MSETEEKVAKPELNNALWLAAIEHGSKPLAILFIGFLVVVWLFWVNKPLFNLLEKSRSLKFGTFEMQLREVADYAKLSPELRALQGLNDDQLQLFLVIGKQRGHITYHGEEVKIENLKKLQEAGLLDEVRTEPNGNLWWRVSEKGHALHTIIRTMVISSIRASASPAAN